MHEPQVATLQTALPQPSSQELRPQSIDFCSNVRIFKLGLLHPKQNHGTNNQPYRASVQRPYRDQEVILATFRVEVRAIRRRLPNVTHNATASASGANAKRTRNGQLASSDNKAGLTHSHSPKYQLSFLHL